MFLGVYQQGWENEHKLEVLRTQTHDLPFKMHWKKVRANIHMPRSVQYPGLCFFFFTPCTLSALIPLSYFFNKSIAMEGRGARKSLLLAAPFPSHSRWKEGRKQEREAGSSSLPSVDCLLVQPETLYDPQLLGSRLPRPLTALRTGPQSSRPPASERCPAWNMREVGSMRSGPAEFVLPLLSQRLETHRTKCLRSHPTPRLRKIEGRRRRRRGRKNENPKSDFLKKGSTWS